MTLGKATKRSTCFVLIGWLDPPTDRNRLRPFSEIQRPENTSPFSILSFAWLSQILVGSGAQLRHSGPLVLASAARPARPPRTLPRPRLAPLALLRLSSARRASEDGIASATAGEPCPPTQHVTMLLATTSDCRHRRPQLASSRCRSTLVPPLGMVRHGGHNRRPPRRLFSNSSKKICRVPHVRYSANHMDPWQVPFALFC